VCESRWICGGYGWGELFGRPTCGKLDRYVVCSLYQDFFDRYCLCHLFVKGFNFWSGLVPVYSLECNSCLNIGRRRCGEVYIADVDGCVYVASLTKSGISLSLRMLSDENDGSHRVQDLWFDDGTLVLQAEGSLFRIYKSILSIKSSVLRGLLSKPPQGTVDDCPLVQLDDSADDLTYFLKSIFNPEYVSLNFILSLSFTVFAAFLRKRKNQTFLLSLVSSG